MIVGLECDLVLLSNDLLYSKVVIVDFMVDMMFLNLNDLHVMHLHYLIPSPAVILGILSANSQNANY